MRIKYLISLLPVALAGCLPTGTSSLDGLTIQTSNDGIYRQPVNLRYPLQSRFLAVNGLLPVPAVGTPCLASSQRPATSIICLSTTGETYALVTEYKYEATLNDINEFQEKLERLDLITAEALVDTTTMADDVRAQYTEKLSKEVDAATADIQEFAAENNIFVFQWSGNGRAGLSGTIGAGTTTPRANANIAGETSGYVIVGGLTVTQLMIDPASAATDWADLPGSTKIATLTYGAKTLKYVASRSAAAVLAANSGTLKLGNSAPATLNTASLNALAEIAAGQRNQGHFSAPTVTRISTPLVGSDQDKQNSQQIFYATMTDVRTLLRDLKP